MREGFYGSITFAPKKLLDVYKRSYPIHSEDTEIRKI